jgi:hypothetical protein
MQVIYLVSELPTEEDLRVTLLYTPIHLSIDRLISPS